MSIGGQKLNVGFCQIIDFCMLHTDAINESKFNCFGVQFRNLVLCVNFKIFNISKLHFQTFDFS